MNKVILCGRITKDVTATASGKMGYTSIAVDRKMKDADGKKQTDFFNLKFLGEKKVQFAQKYATKGTKLIITGELNNDEYKDKDGNNVRNTSIVVDETEFAESKSANTNNAPATSNDGFMNVPAGSEESLPFN